MSTNPLRSLVTLVLLGALLAGCGGPATEPAAEPAATPLPPTPTAIPPTPAPTAEPEAEAPSPVAAAPEPVGLRPDAPPYAVHGPYWVGYKPVVIGEGTDHPIDAGLWYPALNPNGNPEEIIYPMPWKIPSMPLDTEPLAYGHALLDAAINESGAPYPLVVFSPGLGTAAPWYSNLIEHYASYGFVVLAPEHIETWDSEVRDKWSTSIDRPLAIKRTLDYAEQATAAGGDMAGLIDMQHVAVEGHSYGGYTALAMAGAQYDLDAFNARCAALPPGDPNMFFCAPLVSREADMAARAGLDVMPEGLWPSFGDPRVTAIIPIAGDAYLFDKAGLSKITIPMMAIGGTADTGTPYDWGSKLSYDNTSSAKKVLVTLDGAEHTITTSCENLPWMRDTPFGGWICFDPVWDKDRGMDLINHFSTAFLLDTLKGDAEAAKALVPENAIFPGIRYETNAYGAEPLAAAPSEVALQPHQPRPDAPLYGQRGPYAVGVRDFVIDTPERQIPVTVWYPASNPEGLEEAVTYTMDFLPDPAAGFPTGGRALRDAAADPSGGPYPLVLYSHGAWCYPAIASFLLEHLASHGFVVMAAVHEDNWGTGMQTTYKSEISRPQDMVRQLDLAEELTMPGGELAGLIDMEHVAVSGHSFGGTIALEMGGARINVADWQETYCVDFPDDEDCKVYPDHFEEMAKLAGLDAVPDGLWPDWSDPRIDAVVATAPGVSMFSDGGLDGMRQPFMLLVGTNDTWIGAVLEYRKVFETIPAAEKTRVQFEGAGHMIFGNACEAEPGMVDAGFYFICADQVWDMNRAQDLTNHFVTAFLLAELKGDRYAAAALSPENVTFPGIRYETTAYNDAAAAVLDDDTVAKIEAMVEKVMAEGQIPGAAVGIVQDGELVYAKGFGVQELGQDTPMTPDTIFQMSSAAKTPTGLAVMQLVEAGKIDLDAPVTTYLPDFTLADADLSGVTIRRLLSHTAGMPDPIDWLAEYQDENLRNDEAALHDYVHSLGDQALTSQPGTEWAYSNTGFDTLGDVIAQVSGQTFEDYLQANVLGPLGMENSSYLLSDLDPALLAMPHLPDESGAVNTIDFFPYSRAHAPSGMLFASVNDLARFARANLNQGELDGVRILPASAYDEMWAPQADSPWAEMFGPSVASYGLGWWVGDFYGHRIIGNYGAEFGFQSHLALFPDDGMAVIALVNLFDPEAGQFYALQIADAIQADLLGIELPAQ
jgi:CubicO group peptidase (beta-lactamase class C family)/predicted dienelactone hydrolase